MSVGDSRVLKLFLAEAFEYNSLRTNLKVLEEDPNISHGCSKGILF